MKKIIDARGLSCPQPVLMVTDEMEKAGKGEIIILVDTDASRENVSRAAVNKGWEVKDIKKENEGYRITVTRK